MKAETGLQLSTFFEGLLKNGLGGRPVQGEQMREEGPKEKKTSHIWEQVTKQARQSENRYCPLLRSLHCLTLWFGFDPLKPNFDLHHLRVLNGQYFKPPLLQVDTRDLTWIFFKQCDVTV